MNGLGGFSGWRWIFIIEGILSVCFGISSFFIIVPFPDQATKPGVISRKPFLTKAEVGVVLARLEKDRGDTVVDEMTVKNVLHYLGDWKVISFSTAQAR